MQTSVSRLNAVSICSRIAASLLGGYAFVWGLVTLGVVLAVLAGVRYSEAQTAMYLLAFLGFLAVFLWSFAAANLTRVWAVLAGGGALMTALAYLLARAAG